MGCPIFVIGCEIFVELFFHFYIRENLSDSHFFKTQMNDRSFKDDMSRAIDLGGAHPRLWLLRRPPYIAAAHTLHSPARPVDDN